MKYKIKLFSSHDKDSRLETPHWWKNFINYAKNLKDDPINELKYGSSDTGFDDLNRLLKPYNAKFRTSIKKSPWGIRSLTFDSEEDAIYFILRWS